MSALVASGRVDDDKHMEELHVCRRAEQDFAVIIVRSAHSLSHPRAGEEANSHG